MTFLTLYAAIIVTTGCVQPGISDAAITSIIVVFNVSIVTYTMIEEVLEGSDVSEIGSEVLGCASLLASKLGGAVSNVSDDARDDMPASGEQGAGGGRAGGASGNAPTGRKRLGERTSWESFETWGIRSSRSILHKYLYMYMGDLLSRGISIYMGIPI